MDCQNKRETTIYFRLHFFHHIPSESEDYIHLVFGLVFGWLVLLSDVAGNLPHVSQNRLLEFWPVPPDRTVHSEPGL